MPEEPFDGGWLHPSRLPLGRGWHGRCFAPGHEGAQPSPDELREFCNLGYAMGCPRLPSQRNCDAVRFVVTRDLGSQLGLSFVCEAGHRPVAHGVLEYDSGRGAWLCGHSDPRIQKMAECYVQSYLRRKIPSAAADYVSSAPA